MRRLFMERYPAGYACRAPLDAGHDPPGLSARGLCRI